MGALSPSLHNPSATALIKIKIRQQQIHDWSVQQLVVFLQALDLTDASQVWWFVDLKWDRHGQMLLTSLLVGFSSEVTDEASTLPLS
ncbi:hypothetical protein COP2_035591 [Malus domestica]